MIWAISPVKRPDEHIIRGHIIRSHSIRVCGIGFLGDASRFMPYRCMKNEPALRRAMKNFPQLSRVKDTKKD
jgi:hypothetical protein